MREIKFRVWDKKKKLMHSWEDCLREFELSDMFEKTNQELDIEVMEFTGIIDRNDEEICEGDIITFKCGNDGCEYIHKAEIIWMDSFGSFGVKEGHQSFPLQIPILAKDQTVEGIGLLALEEVIGNVYQNADILEK